MMKPEIFAKHAKRVVKNAEKTARNVPAVRYINVDNGILYASDSHRSYRYENDEFETNGLLDTDLNAANIDDLIFPVGVSRAHNSVLQMDQNDNASVYGFKNKELAKVIKELKELNKQIAMKRKEFNVSLENGILKVTNSHDKNQKVEFTSDYNHGSFSFDINALYMIQTLEMFKQADDKIIELKFFQRYRPLLFKGLNNPNLTAIVLPLRIS